MSGGRGPSRQELIRRRRRSGFVGRRSELAAFTEVLGQVPEDAAQFLFHVHGPGGVGKSTLVRQMETAARDAQAATGYVDEAVADPVEAMKALAGQFGQQGTPMKSLERLLNTYQQRRHEADAGLVVAGESASPSPGSVIASRVGLVGLGMIPGVGAFTGALDANQVAAGAEQLKGMLSARFRSHEDVQLVLSPVEALAPVFLQELTEIAQRRSWVVLFFDTYERTGPMLDTWLRDVLLSDRYGELPANVLVVLAGQGRLDAQCWGDWMDLVADLPLDVFTETEARQLLAAKGVTDEHVIEVVLRLSGRLPLLVSTLAESQPSAAAEVGDPVGTAVERFLKWETQPERRAAALACALPQELDEDVYRAAVEDEEARELFGWLRSMPFVIDRSGRCHYHEVVRTAMLRLQRQQSPVRWRRQHERLATTFGEWRAQLACDAEETGGRWRDERWCGYRLQETYHRLCADPDRALPLALRELLDAWSHSTATLLRWVQMLARAGRDTGTGELQEWGDRLVAAMAEPEPGIAATTLLLSGRVLDRPGRAVAYRRRGIGHHGQGRHDLALADFDRSVTLDPDRPEALHSRGRALITAERYEEALADLDRAVELDPDYAAAFATRGEARRLTGQYEEALADFDRAVELDPGHGWALGRRGDTHQELGRHEEALADYDRAVELDPDDRWALIGQGQIYWGRGRTEEALASFGRAIEVDPEDLFSLTVRGEIHRQSGRPEVALADLDRAIELDPEYVLALSFRSHANRDLGRHQASLRDLVRALELDPDNVPALVRRGLTYRELGRLEEALADFARAIEIDGEYGWAFHARGGTYQELGRFEEALADYERAVELDPGDVVALTARGDTCRELGRPEEALASYDRAVELAPHSWWTVLARTWMYRDLGRHQDALDGLDRAIRLMPEEAALFVARGSLHQAMGDHPEALADLDRALALEPDEPRTLAARGHQYVAMGQHTEALADFDRAVELAPGSGWAVEQRGNAHLAMGRYDEALADYDRALELGPDHALLAGSQGFAHRMAGRFAEALTAYDRAVRLDPAHGVLRGVVYRLLGRYDEALADCDRAVEASPAAWLVAARGLTYRLLGRYAEALADLDRAIEEEPEKGWVHYEKGVVLHALGRSEGDACFARAVELLRPGGTVATLSNLVLAHTAASDPAEAAHVLDAFLQAAPSAGQLAELHIELGTLVRVMPSVAEHAAALRQRLLEARAAPG
ncbi:tetratricopeptide repeat protein [Kitasatospora sp. NPDC051984]|uniref:ATP-binding protein n=1 Tax=Kitasatospora sp. NPDC051984 TaxID=3364059 RepID=UPI0037CC7A40